MEQKKSEVKEEVKISEQLIVVKELPTQQVREGFSEDGKSKFLFITEEEALSEILTRLRRVDKAL
jgi:hypothetical protein